MGKYEEQGCCTGLEDSEELEQLIKDLMEVRSVDSSRDVFNPNDYDYFEKESLFQSEEEKKEFVEFLYLKYKRLVWKKVRASFRNRSAQDEVFQDVWLQVCSLIETFRCDSKHPDEMNKVCFRWIEKITSFTILKRTGNNGLYKAARHKEPDVVFGFDYGVFSSLANEKRNVEFLDESNLVSVDPETLALSIEEENYEKETQRRLKEAIRDLSPRQRDAINAELGGSSMCTLSEKKGTKDSTMRVHKFRAHKNLQRKLADRRKRDD